MNITLVKKNSNSTHYQRLLVTLMLSGVRVSLMAWSEISVVSEICSSASSSPILCHHPTSKHASIAIIFSYNDDRGYFHFAIKTDLATPLLTFFKLESSTCCLIQFKAGFGIGSALRWEKLLAYTNELFVQTQSQLIMPSFYQPACQFVLVLVIH